MAKQKRPKVGVGVIVKKSNKILLCKRKGAHGEGTWAPPGGHLEYGENPIDCAKRELLEEANITCKNFRIGPVTNDVFVDESLHYVTIFVICDLDSGEPKIMEPDKTVEWKWFEPTKYPKNLFLPFKNLIGMSLI